MSSISTCSRTLLLRWLPVFCVINFSLPMQCRFYAVKSPMKAKLQSCPLTVDRLSATTFLCSFSWQNVFKEQRCWFPYPTLFYPGPRPITPLKLPVTSMSPKTLWSFLSPHLTWPHIVCHPLEPLLVLQVSLLVLLLAASYQSPFLFFPSSCCHRRLENHGAQSSVVFYFLYLFSGHSCSFLVVLVSFLEAWPPNS